MRTLFVKMLTLMLVVGSIGSVQAQGTILGVVRSDNNFSILEEAIAVADPIVAQTLRTGNNITLLAPNDIAFRNLASFLDVSLDELLGQPAIVTDLLLYHILEGELFSSQLASQFNGAVLPTLLSGAFVNFDLEAATGQLIVNDVVEIVRSDIDAGNGVVHEINDVILNRLINEQIDNTDFSEPTPMAVEALSAFLRVIHASPDAPEVDIYVNDEAVITDLAFGSVTDFANLDSGEYSIAVVAAGAELDEAVIGPLDVRLEVDSVTTVAAVGSLEGETLEAVLLTDTETLEADASRIIIFHALEGGPFVDVLADGEVLVTAIEYPGFVVVDVPAATYVIDVIEDGTPENSLFSADEYEALAGSYQLVAVMGNPDDIVVLTESVSGDEIGLLDAEQTE